jgi:ABC-2 type transport system permease protein
MYLVFVKFLKLGNGVPHFPVYLLFGIVLWNFFAEMTSLSLSSIVGRGDLIRKIRIPRWMIVVSTSITALINLVLNLLVVAVFMALNHVDVMRTILWLPLILLQLYLCALGISLFLAAAYVKYRDVTYIWEVMMQALFYLVPIIYPLSEIPKVLYQKILLLNPIATAVQDARYSLITHTPTTISKVYGDEAIRLVPYGLTVLVLLIGVLYFKKESKYFAENI